VVGFCEHGDEPSDSGAIELVCSLVRFGNLKSEFKCKCLL
jgi:hypothetical protein